MTIGSINIDMKPVQSSSIMAVGYDAGVGALRIQFKGGRTYTYKDVPASVFDELGKSHSVGRFVNKSVVGKFEVVKPEAAK